MTTIARLQIYVQTSGDIVYTQIANIQPSPNSVAEAQVRQVLPGDNQVMIVSTGIPPLILKGAITDVGIRLNANDPSFLAIDLTPELWINNPTLNPVYVKFVWI